VSLLLSPLPGNVIKFRASIYADDLVVFLSPNPQDFSCIREILDLFQGVSGLATNLDKCLVSLTRCTEEQMQDVLQVFPCRVSPLPLTYLGAPLCLIKLKRSDEQRYIDSVAARSPPGKQAY
jgi:hypothetical protein